jgi:antagonist of SinR
MYDDGRTAKIQKYFWEGKMEVIMEKLLVEELDMEWVQLIKEAKKIGMEKKDVRKFLHDDFKDYFIHNEAK